MGNFNRGRSGGGRGFSRNSFNDRGSRGPVELHQAVCDNCRKNCEVPFRPTSGKPIFCSDCFQNNRGSDSRRFEGRGSERSNFAEKRMFDAVCNECGNSCKVPFQPSGEKPVYCSDCFGDKKGNGDRNREQSSQSQDQFEQLHNKLDKILILLSSNIPAQEAQQAVVMEAVEELPVQTEQQVVIEEVIDTKKVKTAKKKPSKKK